VHHDLGSWLWPLQVPFSAICIDHLGDSPDARLPAYLLGMRVHVLVTASSAERAFALATERERVGSVLSDLTKTGGDFHSMAANALDGVAEAMLARMRPILEEVGTVGCANHGCGGGSEAGGG
jgi:hypothetical protein